MNSDNLGEKKEILTVNCLLPLTLIMIYYSITSVYIINKNSDIINISGFTEMLYFVCLIRAFVYFACSKSPSIDENIWNSNKNKKNHFCNEISNPAVINLNV